MREREVCYDVALNFGVLVHTNESAAATTSNISIICEQQTILYPPLHTTLVLSYGVSGHVSIMQFRFLFFLSQFYMFISCCGVVVPYYYPALTQIITPEVEIIFDKLLVFLNLLLECRANRHDGLGRMVRDLQQMDRESYKG